MESFVTKNSTQKIRISNGHFKGHDFVDMRLFVSDGSDELIPTPRGITFPYTKIREVIEGLQELAKHLDA
jgi:hypothetical protein